MKKFLSYLNFWKLDLYSRSYTSGIIRIFGSALVMLIVMLVRSNLTISNIPLNLFVLFISIVIIVLATLCFFTAAVECLQVGENRRKDKEK